ncbi:MAG: HAMP domain-containing sensor histidine kinase [Longicatena sp.]
MKRIKYLYVGVIVCVLAFLQTFFHFDEYTLLLLLALAFIILWELLDRSDISIQRRENFELQEEIKSTATDAHLKNKQLLTVVTSIPFPMLLLDRSGHVVMHNNISEISHQEGSSEGMTFTHNNYVFPVQEFIKDSFIMEKAMDKIISIDGIEYQSIAVPVTAKSKFSGCLVLFQDISKTLEGEKMQKRFIADASHELKTPIAVIKGMVEILNRDDFHDDQTRNEFLEQIEAEINRLDTLVKDLLQLSRLSLSSLILKREKIDLTTVIDKGIKSLAKSASAKNLIIQKEYDTHELVFCDEMKMSQVILNLLSNAIKYSDEGSITIKTYVEDGYYIMSVHDEGHGIALSDQEKIFERFYRVDDARSRLSGGSGLGLPIVKSIVEAHGGNIHLISEPNKGTTFYVKLK